MDEPVDRDISKAEILEQVQAAFEICATCAHTKADHPGACSASWYVTGSQHTCKCSEFWPMRREAVDGLQVMAWEVTIGGSASIPQSLRGPSEWWDRLRAGRTVTLTVRLDVDGKAIRVMRDDGVAYAVADVRKLKVRGVVFEGVEGD